MKSGQPGRQSALHWLAMPESTSWSKPRLEALTDGIFAGGRASWAAARGAARWRQADRRAAVPVYLLLIGLGLVRPPRNAGRRRPEGAARS